MTKPRKLSTKRQQRHQPRQRSKRRSSSSSPLSLTLLSTTTILSLTTPQHHLLTTAQCNPCTTISTGYIQIPKTNCAEFAQCSNGLITQRFTCQSGLIYDSNMNQCNWEWGATCGPDVECPITESPTGGPTTGTPTESPVRRSTDVPTPADGDGENSLFPPPLAPVSTPANPPLEPTMQTPPTTPDTNNNQPTLEPPPPPPQQPPSIRLPHHSAVWAHLNANKISISNQLLRVAHRLHDIHHTNGGVSNTMLNANNKEDSSVRMYAYYDFYNGLRSMSEVGYVVPTVGGKGGDDGADDDDDAGDGDRATFYLGNSNQPDAAAIGLVNVATFLSQAMADSISHGSCDESNTDTVDGTLPQSNACGQYGKSYQDMNCKAGEEYMQCNSEVYYGEMTMVAKDHGLRPDVQPFFCGGRDVYPSTGSGELIAGREQSNVVDDFSVPNRNGRVDVEGCCYWGRGTIQTTGICQYGKLNYYLGARAHAEGRPARYPTIDFCTNPQSICSTGKPIESSIEWITGLFRWIDSVQNYDYYNSNSNNGQEEDTSSWNYIQKLQEFVEGGMVDGLFLHSVSAIVTQGCHEAPCPSVEGTVVTMDDANLRYSYFLQVLEALGLPVDALRQS